MKWITVSLLLAQPALADPMAVHQTADAIFDRMPNVRSVDTIGDHCGAGRRTNPRIGYCTSENTIYVSTNFAARPTAAYEMAHVLGHAIQVQHGVADVAFQAIRSRRSEEGALRGMVTRQVECVAGVLVARTGLAPIDLTSHFNEEPFTDPHWGRRPLSGGPRVTIGIEARADWFTTGYDAADFAACSVGEMSSELIVQAER